MASHRWRLHGDATACPRVANKGSPKLSRCTPEQCIPQAVLPQCLPSPDLSYNPFRLVVFISSRAMWSVVYRFRIFPSSRCVGVRSVCKSCQSIGEHHRRHDRGHSDYAPLLSFVVVVVFCRRCWLVVSSVTSCTTWLNRPDHTVMGHRNGHGSTMGNWVRSGQP